MDEMLPTWIEKHKCSEVQQVPRTSYDDFMSQDLAHSPRVQKDWGFGVLGLVGN